MKKSDNEPNWIETLRVLLAHKGFNPRSLSLAAGLNATAVRDMLEGRAKSPRYDTVEALAKTLGVTPAQLMGGKPESILAQLQSEQPATDPLADDELNLLTEIISKLQEAAQAYRQSLRPDDFAAMVTSIYRQLGNAKDASTRKAEIAPRIESLIAYESLRQKTSGGR